MPQSPIQDAPSRIYGYKSYHIEAKGQEAERQPSSTNDAFLWRKSGECGKFPRQIGVATGDYCHIFPEQIEAMKDTLNTNEFVSSLDFDFRR